VLIASAAGAENNTATYNELLRQARQIDDQIREKHRGSHDGWRSKRDDLHAQLVPLYAARDAAAATIPGFWLRAMEGYPTQHMYLKAKGDKELLAHVTHIKCERLKGGIGIHDFKITLTFEKNDYIKDKTLWREVWEESQKPSKVSYISWKKGMAIQGESFFNLFDDQVEGGFEDHWLQTLVHILNEEIYPDPVRIMKLKKD
jgi:hypothetical protein